MDGYTVSGAERKPFQDAWKSRFNHIRKWQQRGNIELTLQTQWVSPKQSLSGELRCCMDTLQGAECLIQISMQTRVGLNLFFNKVYHYFPNPSSST